MAFIKLAVLLVASVILVGAEIKRKTAKFPPEKAKAIKEVTLKCLGESEDAAAAMEAVDNGTFLTTQYFIDMMHCVLTGTGYCHKDASVNMAETLPLFGDDSEIVQPVIEYCNEYAGELCAKCRAFEYFKCYQGESPVGVTFIENYSA